MITTYRPLAWCGYKTVSGWQKRADGDGFGDGIGQGYGHRIVAGAGIGHGEGGNNWGDGDVIDEREYDYYDIEWEVV